IGAVELLARCAAELNALVEAKVQAFRMRMKAVFKEREKIVKDQAQKDRQGNLKYDNPAEPDPKRSGTTACAR
ncbi:MAG TPA: hypothetical protein PL002_16195, partial [Flavobacteriales bacterium]|nr:hypothetical protein [Flavobacteriales bacterium]